jgi:hypothetical protein
MTEGRYFLYADTMYRHEIRWWDRRRRGWKTRIVQRETSRLSTLLHLIPKNCRIRVDETDEGFVVRFFGE